ncbi:hypothetical protein A7C99_1188 [Trichophyton rubrum]|uniref:Uncharacterized protein n=1 Tax=Trichophyton rubrum TaxID=5551 RepID=A0A178F586_TRIRU|nr:hypothetical protein A7C99_1188 [Trichophyton rubrum]
MQSVTKLIVGYSVVVPLIALVSSLSLLPLSALVVIIIITIININFSFFIIVNILNTFVVVVVFLPASPVSAFLLIHDSAVHVVPPKKETGSRFMDAGWKSDDGELEQEKRQQDDDDDETTRRSGRRDSQRLHLLLFHRLALLSPCWPSLRHRFIVIKVGSYKNPALVN